MKRVLIVFVSLFSLSLFASENDSIVGYWKTIDDETEKVKSIVQIEKDGEVFKGTVVKLFKKPEEDQNPLCKECKGELKDKPILGMTIITNLKKRDGDWGDGDILDPNNGKTYDVKMSLQDDGKKLKVRGFLGFSLLGRTQYWYRQEKLD